MNIQISIFIPFSGATEGLEPIVDALAETLDRLGYGTNEDSEFVGSLITVDESELSQWSDTTEFVAHQIRISPMWAIPKQGEKNDSA